MKNIIAKIKKNAGKESKKALYVILGFASGTAIAKGMDWIANKYPQYASILSYGKPILIGGGGWFISTLTEEDKQALKHLGYGLQVSGALEGAKLLPFAKDFLSGVDSGMGTTYYIENGKPLIDLGNFGINSLPVGSINLETAPSIKLDLPNLEGTDPELEGTEEDQMNGLGYNSEKFDGII